MQTLTDIRTTIENVADEAAKLAQPVAKTAWDLTEKATEFVAGYLPKSAGSKVETTVSDAKTWFDNNIFMTEPARKTAKTVKTETAAKSTATKSTAPKTAARKP
jgi:hypothetical protein